MYRCAIVADDLTGANASGGILRSFGLSSLTLTGDLPTRLEALEPYDALVYPTGSRALPAAEAYRRVHRATLALARPSVCLYTKRIDSTLRGNVGPEIDAMLDALSEIDGQDRLAVAVPAYPQAGRLAAGGFLLVNGVLLQRSDAGRDPKTPVATSLAPALVGKDSHRKVAHVDLDTVYAGPAAMAAALTSAYQDGRRIAVLDAIQPEDIEMIAEAVIRSGLPFIAVDPGPFTAALAGRLVPVRTEGGRPRVLLAVGSVTATTAEQLEELYRSYAVAAVYLDPLCLIAGSEQRTGEVRRAADALASAPAETELVCLTTNALAPATCLDLQEVARRMSSDRESVSGIINLGIAEIVALAVEADRRVRGLFLSGGDTTLAVLHRFQATGMAVEGEVLPLAAYGRVKGGRLDGMLVVTKGGTVGDREAIKACTRFLLSQIAAVEPSSR